MLTKLNIEGFLRVPYAAIDLTGAAIHAFYGLNEHGKSSIAEAVRFVYRGLSPRVSRKGDFEMLVTDGKRGGSVELVANDTSIRRNIKNGALTSRADMNFDDLHVDIQLGALPFGLADENKLRPLLLDLFKAKADEKIVYERLVAKGVNDDVLKLALPLIKKVGFSTAHDQAKAKKSEATGAWRNITGESYGHVKAETWKPDLLDVPAPSDEQIDKMSAEVDRLAAMRDSYQIALTAARTTLQLAGTVSDGTTVEDAQSALAVAEDQLRECQEQIDATVERYKQAIEQDEERLRTTERALIDAKNSATQLTCPCCQAAVQIVMVDREPVLERAVNERAGATNVAAAASAVNMARQALQARKQGRETTMAGLNQARGQAQDAVQQERNTLDNAKRLQHLPKVTQAELEELQSELELVNGPLANAKSLLDEMQLKRKHIGDAREDEKNAKEQHRLAQQWALVEEACGPTSSGIPAELVGRITEPMNEAIKQIADLWGQYSVIITPDMQVQSDTGRAYALMSESARWRADAMIQLALAQLTTLKVVVIDRFDVALARSMFFDMLSQYTETNPDVTVLAFGTLKNTPPPFPGVKFHHVIDGAVRDLSSETTNVS